jgi:hypothetical protein
LLTSIPTKCSAIESNFGPALSQFPIALMAWSEYPELEIKVLILWMNNWGRRPEIGTFSKSQ